MKGSGHLLVHLNGIQRQENGCEQNVMVLFMSSRYLLGDQCLRMSIGARLAA